MTWPRQLDPLLVPLAQATDEAAAEVCLNNLLTQYVEPPARAFFYKKFDLSAAGAHETTRAEDAADACGEVNVKVLQQLRGIRAGSAGITHFRRYVQRAIENTWHDWLNERNPERAGLYHRIRYLLQHDEAFVVREHWRCGLPGGGAEESPYDTAQLVRQVEAHHPAFVRDKLPELVTEILLRAKGCVALGALVGAAAALLNIKGLEYKALEDASDWPAGNGRKPEDDLFSRFTLQEVWAETRQLPHLPRAALLLNLRNPQGRDALVLLLVTQIATPDELVEAVGLTPEQFAEVSGRLPLKDAEIAALLGITAKQVGNLRWTARDYLRRRAGQK